MTTIPLTFLAVVREKHPYTFADLIVGPASHSGSGVSVPIGDGLASVRYDVTVIPTRLETGDYSLPGAEHRVTVSRKSLADLYATIGTLSRRANFMAEIERMSRFEWAAVVVEEDWRIAPAPRSVGVSRAFVTGFCDSLVADYPSVAWAHPRAGSEGRRGGEVATFLLLLAVHQRLTAQRRESDGADQG